MTHNTDPEREMSEAEVELVLDQAVDFNNGGVFHPLDVGQVHHMPTIKDYEAYSERVRTFAGDVISAITALRARAGVRYFNEDGDEYTAAQLGALLNGRDEFIAARGLWDEFVKQLPLDASPPNATRESVTDYDGWKEIVAVLNNKELSGALFKSNTYFHAIFAHAKDTANAIEAARKAGAL